MAPTMENIFISAGVSASLVYFLHRISTFLSEPNLRDIETNTDLDRREQEIAAIDDFHRLDHVNEQYDVENIEEFVNLEPVLGDGDMAPLEAEIPATHVCRRRNNNARKRSKRTRRNSEVSHGLRKCCSTFEENYRSRSPVKRNRNPSSNRNNANQNETTS